MKNPKPAARPEKEEKEPESEKLARLLPLFRLLLRKPPKDHDPKTCPICKRYGIKNI
jgi:hypothetical protein